MTTALTKAEQRIKTALAVFINLQHPVAIAIEPLREKAVARAEIEAKKRIEMIREDLAKHDDDLEKAAPYPDSNMGRGPYIAALNKHHQYSGLCKHRATTHRRHDPDFVDIDPDRVKKFIQTCKEGAANDYDAFIVKLCQKIGDCKSASIEGDHVWGRSYLTVEKEKVIEVWMTQQIINVSKLGRLFNQWPSRQMKR